jgi:hypothetical protein
VGDDLRGEAVGGEGVEGGLEVGVEVGGDGGGNGVAAEADDPGVAFGQEELDQAVPALGVRQVESTLSGRCDNDDAAGLGVVENLHA